LRKDTGPIEVNPDAQGQSMMATGRAKGGRKLERPASPIDPTLLYDVGGFVDDPEAWFLTPNPEFEGRRPVDLLGTEDEVRLRNRIGAAKLGMFS
jgi:hypothetical protein